MTADNQGMLGRRAAEKSSNAMRDPSAPRLFTWRTIVLLVACVLGYLGLWAAVDAADGGALAIDEAAYRALSLGLRSDAMTLFMRGVSLLGTGKAVAATIVIVLIVVRAKRTTLYCAASAIGIHYLNALLKDLACRPRPDEARRLIAATGYSFPSGHAMNAVALLGLLAWFVWRSDLPRRTRTALCTVLGAVAALVCISRVYLGVHYLSDVLAGACAAGAWLVLFTRPVLVVERALAKRGADGGEAGQGESADVNVSQR